MTFITIPRLKKIPYLIHGFGMQKWEENDFRRRLEWKNFRRLFLDQIHSDIIHFIEKNPKRELKGDAMITSLPFLLLIIKTADCLPILIVDEFRKIIAAVHCGWRGTSKSVVQKVILGMNGHYSCQPSSLLVALGPCIEQECYEVGEDVLQSFEKEGLSTEFFKDHPLREGKYLFDLKGANLSQMSHLGVKEKNVFPTDICTHCHSSIPSFRREKDKAGRMLSFIGMSF